jgi:TnpA family transposase
MLTNTTIAEDWMLIPEDLTFVMNKDRGNRLIFALMLLFYRLHGRFPNGISEFNPKIINMVAQQLIVSVPRGDFFEKAARTLERHRAEIRKITDFREATNADAEMLTEWLQENAAIVNHNPNQLVLQLEERCRQLQIEPPSPARLDNIVRTVTFTRDEDLYSKTYARLDQDVRNQLDILLQPDKSNIDTQNNEVIPAILMRLRSDTGRVSLLSARQELNKLKTIRGIKLPSDLFVNVSEYELERYQQHVMVEAPYELRRHSPATRLTWLAAFVYLRGRAVTDNLVDLLIETIYHIEARAERRADRKLLAGWKHVANKETILYEMASIAIAYPEETIKEAIYPVIGLKTLVNIVRELGAVGNHNGIVHDGIRNSYKSHYRRIIPLILQVLEFRSNNELYHPIIQALELIKTYADSKIHTFPANEEVPIEGVVRKQWKNAVVEKDEAGHTRINRITYEICVLEALRNQLRCREIWVVGADRYRNPDEDLPADFEIKRKEYYEALKLPLDPDEFINNQKNEMHVALSKFDSGLPKNPRVKILNKSGGWISVTPFDPQPEPENLITLKAEITATWPMTSLLDVIKETDLRLNFTEAFKSLTSYKTMERIVLQPRLLLCLHGLGTNTGLMRMVGPESGMTYKDLIYVRKRYFDVDALRQANATVVNGTLRIRNEAIWGEGSTSCASDSKHFKAYDQNLMTKYHIRYGGRGVMIYWHVEKKSLCIHSQVKSPSSSEVSSMIEGVLRHLTDIEIENQYVDSHGQSTVGFAFCRLLNFSLLPRLKPIHSQKLYRPDSGQPRAYKNLQLVLTKPIDWELIKQQYDQMVKYVTALRLGTAETEAIMRRFTRNNVQHPTYKAFMELGRAVKTIYLCNYLHSESLRREIHEGLNVIEQWNGATDFVLYARRGELVSNRQEDHEISMLSLQLLQNCMIYINTLMLQTVLDKPHWQGRLTQRDLGALTPLIWEHINPYGRFELDMNTRIPLI